MSHHHRKHHEPVPHVWRLRIPALIALGISLFLIYQKSKGNISSIAGCGGEGGCAQVLGGRWSEWFGVPVTVLAAGMYIGVLLLTLDAITRTNSHLARKGLLAGGMLALAAACWFIGLLLFVEKAFCPYCLATHVCGIIFGVMVLKSLGKPQEVVVDRRKKGHKHERGLAVPAVVAFFGITALAIGQILGKGPDTYEIVNFEPGTPGQNPKADVGKERQVLYANDQIAFELPESPHIGAIDSKHVIVEFFDYTCKSCRQMHGDMHLLLESHADDFLVILTPCPLNILCNPHFTGDSLHHTDSCEYAKLALSLWRAAPDKFAKFHEFMMTGKTPPPLPEASAKAKELAGADALATAQKDAWVDARLQKTFDQYKLLAANNPRMPKLLLGGTAILNGLARDSQTFVQVMRQQFKLQP